jgi:hypothetical protein
VPELDLIPVPLYNALQPYHVDFDNLPLHALITRIGVVNDAVDIVQNDIQNSVGTQSTLAQRLGMSLNGDGSLKPAAVDNCLHNIGYHTDGIGPDSVAYVRMQQAERDKLALVNDEATNMTIDVQTISNIVMFNQGPIVLEPSWAITWVVTPPNKVSAQLAFPVDAIHRHYYDVSPVSTNYQNYTTGLPTQYMDGSLRVFINGVRLSSSGPVYVPSANISAPWTLNQFTPTVDHLGFILQNAITLNDTIRIDFDIALS